MDLSLSTFFGSGNEQCFDEKIDCDLSESQTIRCQPHFRWKVWPPHYNLTGWWLGKCWRWSALCFVGWKIYKTICEMMISFQRFLRITYLLILILYREIKIWTEEIRYKRGRWYAQSPISGAFLYFEAMNMAATIFEACWLRQWGWMILFRSLISAEIIKNKFNKENLGNWLSLPLITTLK